MPNRHSFSKRQLKEYWRPDPNWPQGFTEQAKMVYLNTSRLLDPTDSKYCLNREKQNICATNQDLFSQMVQSDVKVMPFDPPMSSRKCSTALAQTGRSKVFPEAEQVGGHLHLLLSHQQRAGGLDAACSTRVSHRLLCSRLMQNTVHRWSIDVTCFLGKKKKQTHFFGRVVTPLTWTRLQVSIGQAHFSSSQSELNWRIWEKP